MHRATVLNKRPFGQFFVIYHPAFKHSTFLTVNSSSQLTPPLCSSWVTKLRRIYFFIIKFKTWLVERVSTRVGNLTEMLYRGKKLFTSSGYRVHIEIKQPLKDNFSAFNLPILLMSVPVSFRVASHPGQSLLKVASSHSVEIRLDTYLFIRYTMQ